MNSQGQINRIQDIINAFAVIEKEKAQILSKCFDSFDIKLADKIRKDGLPKVIFCSEKIVEYLSNTISMYCQVIGSSVIIPEQILFQWEEDI